jgi:protein-S-isoprenylcysteine O-methyltransferase Ste14
VSAPGQSFQCRIVQHIRRSFEIGFGLALWISLFAAPALLTVHLIAVLPDERYLSEKFGESYKTYRAQVRRYL